MKLRCHPERARGREATEGDRGPQRVPVLDAVGWGSKDPYVAEASAPRQGILPLKLLALAFTLAMIAVAYADSTLFVTASPTPLIKLHAGESAATAFRFHVGAGYHINSSKPKSDLLIPTELKLDAAAPFAVKDLAYPPGKDLTLSFDPAHPLSVYSGDFIVHAQLAAARSAAPGRYQLTGELRYQACSDRACYPPKKLPISLEVEVLPEK